MKTSVPKNILIYRLGSLGDTIMVLPCFHFIKNKYPEADITLLTNRPVAGKAAPIEAILGSGYFFNRIIDYPVGTRDVKLLRSLIKQIRALEIDTVINLSATRSRVGTMRDQLFFKAAGIKTFIGFPQKNEDYTVQFDATTGYGEWEAKRLMRRIDRQSSVDLRVDQNWDLKLTIDEEKTAADIFAQLSPGSSALAISLGTKNQSNDWGITNWTALLQRLSAQLHQYKLLVIGAGDETALAEQCLAAWGQEGVNLCGKISPRVSAAVLKCATVFVGHDSGPIHLAACVGTPCVGIYSARNLPGQWFPRGDRNKIIYHMPECAGCGLETCIVQQKKCIMSITVNEVYDATMSLCAVNSQQSFIV